MFWKINSKEYIELLNKHDVLQNKVIALELELGLYVKKLKASKGFTKLKEEEKDDTKDLKENVLLDDDGKPLS